MGEVVNVKVEVLDADDDDPEEDVDDGVVEGADPIPLFVNVDVNVLDPLVMVVVTIVVEVDVILGDEDELVLVPERGDVEVDE